MGFLRLLEAQMSDRGEDRPPKLVRKRSLLRKIGDQSAQPGPQRDFGPGFSTQ
jgi:hypothetical protein